MSEKNLSVVASLIAGAEAVVLEDMKTWTVMKDKEDKDTEFYRTPFGVMHLTQMQGFIPVLVKATKKGIYETYGRSKYVPHQGKKECATRRIKLGLTN